MTDPNAVPQNAVTQPAPQHSPPPAPAPAPAQARAPEAAPSPASRPAPPARPTRAAKARRRKRTWDQRLQSENLRMLLSLALGMLTGALLGVLVPQANYTLRQQQGDQLFSLLLMLIVVITTYSLAYGVLTYLALRRQPRTATIALARLGHARRHVPVYKYVIGRSGPVGEVVQIMGTALVSIVLLALRPPEFAVALLLGFTAVALVCTWISTVLTFALQYAAADAHGEAFAFPATPAAERGLEEYLYAAVVIQAAPGPSGVEPITREARRLVRNHVILAHTTSTIIITLAVSVVITALT